MPPFPSLPTDSLYKFLAFTGLVLVTAGIVAPPFLVRDAFDTTEQYYQQGRQELDNIVFRLGELLQKDGLTGEDRIRSVEGFAKAIDQRNHDARSDVKRKEAELEAQLKVQMQRLSLGFWFGIVLMIAGLLPWYFFVQSLQDHKLRAENEVAQLNLEIAKAANPEAVQKCNTPKKRKSNHRK